MARCPLVLRRPRHTLLALCALLAGSALAPSLAQATTAPYAPPPTAKFPEFHDPLALTWRWGTKTTTLLSAQVTTAGPSVTMIAQYLHPARKRTALVWQITADGKTEIADALAKLERKTYTAGYKLELTLIEPGTLPQEALFTFRRDRIPTVHISFPAL